jgi:acetyl esterase/lipase
MIQKLCRVALFLTLVVFHFSGSLSAQEPEKSRFDRWDKNGDGKLTRDELPAAPRKNFDRIDRNGDGHISREEDAAVGNRNQQAAENQKSGQARLPEGVKKLADLDYAGNDNPRQKLDLYLPAVRSADKPLPLLVFIHGGGWRNGNKASGLGRIAPFLQDGKMAGASVGYRLSDEAQWPSQIHDCKAAIRFLKAHADEYGIDADRIAVMGTSAGGHLVAMLGVSGDVPELEGKIGEHGDQSSEVACVVNFFGPSDLLSMNGEGGTMDHEAPESPESLLVGGPILERKDIARQASPITHVSKADEPMLIVHGDKDPLVIFSQSVKFEKALEAAEVPTTLIRVEGGEHGKGFGPTVNKLVAAFLRQQFFGGEEKVTDQVIKAGE